MTARINTANSSTASPRRSVETDLAEPVESREQIEEILAEIRLMITEGTHEDHKTLTQNLVGHTPVEGRDSINPSFIAPTQKVRVLARVVRLAGIEPAAFRSGAERSIR